MAIIRWKPWNLPSLDDDWDFPTIPGLTRLGSGLNLYESEDEIVAEAALPGIPDDKIDITIDDGIVRITGSSSGKQEETSQRRYYMSSMSQSFNYSFRLPDGITDEEPSAEVANGVLTLRFKKIQKAPPKKVKVISRSKQTSREEKTK